MEGDYGEVQHLSATCICEGIPCRYCKTSKVRRPISNRFDESDGTVWHTSHFGSVSPCPECHVAGRGPAGDSDAGAA